MMAKQKVEEYLIDAPFGGLLGNGVIVKVVQEFVADPDSTYSLTDLANFTGSSVPAVKEAIEKLLATGFVQKVNKNPLRPNYMAVSNSNRLLAMTLLSYSVVDDEKGSQLMENAIREYCGGMFPNNQVKDFLDYSPSTYGHYSRLISQDSNYIDTDYEETMM